METRSFLKGLQCIRKSFEHPGKLYFTQTNDRSHEYDIIDSIEAWFDGYQSIENFEWINTHGRYPAGGSKWEFYRFCQIILDDASAVGCAIVRIPGSIHITCIFDESISYQPDVYEYGPMGTKCQTGMNPKYPGLCNEKESKTNSGTANQPVAWFIKIMTLTFNLILTKLFIF